jgi:hypothetical protein
MSVTFQTVPPALTQAQFNAERQAFCNKLNAITSTGVGVGSYTHIFRKSGAVFEVYDSTSTLIYGGSDDAGGVDGDVAQDVWDAVVAVAKHIYIASMTATFDMDFTGLHSIKVTGEHKNNVVITGVLTLKNCWGIDLSDFQIVDTTYTRTMLSIQAANTESVWNCSLQNIVLDRGAVGIDFLTSGNGWIGANYFKQIWIAAPRSGMTQSGHGTDYVNGNTFDTVVMQCDAGVTAGLTLPEGVGNVWLNVQVDDMPGGVNRCTVKGWQNLILGGNLDYAEYTDSGTWTNNICNLKSSLNNVETLTINNSRGVYFWNAAGSGYVNALTVNNANQCVLANSEGDILLNAKSGSGVYPNSTMTFPNNTVLRWQNAAAANKNVLWMNTSNYVNLQNTEGPIIMLPKATTAVYVGESGGGIQDVILNVPVVATGGATLKRSNRVWFTCSRYTGGAETSFTPGLYFEPRDATKDEGALTLVGAEVAAAAGASASKYLTVVIDSVPYKIALLADS